MSATETEEIKQSITNLCDEINALEKEIENLENFRKENIKAKNQVSDEMYRRVQVGAKFRELSNRAQYANILAQRIEDNYGSSSSAELLGNFEQIEIMVNDRIEYLEKRISKKSNEIIALEERNLQEV